MSKLNPFDNIYVVIIDAVQNCFKEINELIDEEDESKRCRQEINVCFEFFIFFMHVVNRTASIEMSVDQHKELQEFLGPAVADLAVGVFKNYFPETNESIIRTEFFEKLNKAEYEYSKAKEVYSEENPITGNSLFSILARKVAVKIEKFNNPAVLVSVLNVSTKQYTDMKLHDVIQSVIQKPECDEMKHEEVKKRYENGAISIGIDPAVARRFYTSNETGKSANGFIVKSFMALEYVSMVAVLITSVITIKFYSIIFVPVFLLLWFLYAGMASMKKQNISGVLIFTLLLEVVSLYYSNKLGAVSYLIAVIPFPFLFAKLMYSCSVVFFRRLVVDNISIYEFFLNKGVFVKKVNYKLTKENPSSVNKNKIQTSLREKTLKESIDKSAFHTLNYRNGTTRDYIKSLSKEADREKGLELAHKTVSLEFILEHQSRFNMDDFLQYLHMMAYDMYASGLEKNINDVVQWFKYNTFSYLLNHTKVENIKQIYFIEDCFLLICYDVIRNYKI